MKIHQSSSDESPKRIDPPARVSESPKPQTESTLNPIDTPLSDEALERAKLLRELEAMDQEKLQALALNAIEDAAALTRVKIAELTKPEIAAIIVATQERRLRVLQLLKGKID